MGGAASAGGRKPEFRHSHWDGISKAGRDGGPMRQARSTVGFYGSVWICVRGRRRTGPGAPMATPYWLVSHYTVVHVYTCPRRVLSLGLAQGDGPAHGSAGASRPPTVRPGWLGTARVGLELERLRVGLDCRAQHSLAEDVRRRSRGRSRTGPPSQGIFHTLFRTLLKNT